MRMALPPWVFKFIDPFAAYFKLRPNEKEISRGNNNQIALKGVTSFACPGSKGL
jgi:hypothetical protein